MTKKHWFEDTIRTAGITAVAFLFVALALAGCNAVVTDAYTFRFKVQNDSEETITKVKFLNGSNKGAFVLRETYGLTLGTNELSYEYRVSGFTEEYGADERYCAVIVSYEDGTDIFGYWYAGPESKILITSKDKDPYLWWDDKKEIVFSSGNW
jgi:hypothetical protein